MKERERAIPLRWPRWWGSRPGMEHATAAAVPAAGSRGLAPAPAMAMGT